MHVECIALNKLAGKSLSMKRWLQCHIIYSRGRYLLVAVFYRQGSVFIVAVVLHEMQQGAPKHGKLM